MSPPAQALLVVAAPWLLALPIAEVERVLLAEALTAPPVAAQAHPALLGTVLHAGGPRIAVDLGALLGLPSGTESWILVTCQRLPLALRAGRCLQVAPLAGPVRPLPVGFAGGHLALGGFPAGPLAERHGLAALGLALAAERLLPVAAVGAARALLQVPAAAGSRA